MGKDIQRCLKCNSEVYDMFQDNLFHNCKASIPSRNSPKHLKPKGLCCLIPFSASIINNSFLAGDGTYFVIGPKLISSLRMHVYSSELTFIIIFFIKDTYHFEKKQVAIKIMNLDYSRLGAQVHCICL